MGSKSKNESYEILRNPQRRSDTKVKKTKKENALDIISKSLKKNTNANCLKGSDSILINI